MCARLSLLVILLCVFSFSANAQQYPIPVHLNIANIPQETTTWGWVAVAQQIIFAIQGNNTPPQCAMVSIANNTRPEACCNQLGKWNGNQACLVRGHLTQIQNLILHFGGHYSNTAPPTDPLTIYNTLRSNRPIIMFVKQSAYQQVGHFVIITGMQWVNTGFGFQPILYINDPVGFMTQPVPFANIAQFWQAAIVVN